MSARQQAIYTHFIFSRSDKTPPKSKRMSQHVGRQRVRGSGRRVALYIQKAYTYQFKLRVIENPAGTNINSTIERFFPDFIGQSSSSTHKLIYRWSRDRTRIEASQDRLASSRKAQTRGLGTTLPPAAEAALMKWVNDYRRDGVPVSATMLKLQALEIAKDLPIPDGSFSASSSWVSNFTSRHQLSFRAMTHQGQEVPPVARQKAAAFTSEVSRVVAVEGITNIYNTDQTAVLYELLPKTTLAPTGLTTVSVKCGKKEKERMTAMVMGDVHGTKYPLFLVTKATPSKIPAMLDENKRLRHGFGRRVWTEMKELQEEHEVQIYENKNAWWTGELTVEFIRFHFGDRKPFSDPILVLLDDFSGHWVDEAVAYAAQRRIVLMRVPPGLTWLCQPADAVWIKPIKDRLRRHWLDRLREQLARHRRDSRDTPFDLKHLVALPSHNGSPERGATFQMV